MHREKVGENRWRITIGANEKLILKKGKLGEEKEEYLMDFFMPMIIEVSIYESWEHNPQLLKELIKNKDKE